MLPVFIELACRARPGAITDSVSDHDYIYVDLCVGGKRREKTLTNRLQHLLCVSEEGVTQQISK